MLGYPYYVPPMVWIAQNAAQEAGVASSYYDAAGFFAAGFFNDWAGGASESLGLAYVLLFLGVAAVISSGMFMLVDLEPPSKNKVG